MAKIDGDDRELTETDAATVKGMIARGDKQHHIASWFGVDSRAVSHVANGKKFPNVRPGRQETLPPPGPYRIDDRFTRFYQQVSHVNALWNQRLLKDAKELLEASLRNPILGTERTDIETDADDLLRDEYGLLP